MENDNITTGQILLLLPITWLADAIVFALRVVVFAPFSLISGSIYAIVGDDPSGNLFLSYL